MHQATGADQREHKAILEAFKLAKYRITLKAREPMVLPEFKGSMLRGGFGHVFKRICCTNREGTCDGCHLRESCPYAYIFETTPPEGAEHMVTHQKVPRPYVFEPPLDSRIDYNTGESLTFHLVLIGQGIDFLPYFIFSLRELGDVGITKRHHKFELASIHAVDCLTNKEFLVYESDENVVHAEKAIVTGADLIGEAQRFTKERLTLNFLAPTRIKYQGSYCFNELPMQALIQNLTLRINALSYFHNGGIWDDELKLLREKTVGIRIVSASVSKKDVQRYSNRQKRRDSLSGITGLIQYEGDFEPLLPILLLGQFVHTGSDAVFGCGQYEVS
ncbi:MAG: CRISPR system precrRNA processing endoribonuclease RAMP protein Cas6 [Actinomycetota bacterium]|nr:CRISPR system precrRNA processing endoribonuclease RAMP protein Cas6 [Actinomycetota bacterium]